MKAPVRARDGHSMKNIERTRDEDEDLQDNGNLEVDDHVQLVVVVVDGTSPTAVQGHTELVLEEHSLDDDNDTGKMIRQTL